MSNIRTFKVAVNNNLVCPHLTCIIEFVNMGVGLKGSDTCRISCSYLRLSSTPSAADPSLGAP